MCCLIFLGLIFYTCGVPLFFKCVCLRVSAGLPPPAFEMLQRPALAATLAANPRAILVLVLVPTRELALQVPLRLVLPRGWIH